MCTFFFRRTVSKISIRGRLAIGLHCFTTACQSRGLLDHSEIQRFLDHMWQLVSPDVKRFAELQESDPLLVNIGFGDEFPQVFLDFLKSKHVGEGDFRILLGNVVEIVFVNYYGASNNSQTLKYLMTVVEYSRRLDGKCPDPTLFAHSRWADKSGWGSDLSAETLAEWRRFPG
jgi:hypothetical protein